MLLTTAVVQTIPASVVEYTKPQVAYAQEAPAVPPEAPVTNAIACNCYLYVKARIPSFPLTKDVFPNSAVPVVGGVIIMQYPRLVHYVIVTAISKEGVYIDESNFKHCVIAPRFLTWEYLGAHQAKYWVP